MSVSEYPASKRSNVPVQGLETEPSTTTDYDSTMVVVTVESSDDVAPDTQTDQEHPITEQSPPISLVVEADLPATIPADTTSDEATEPVEETGLTSSQGYEMREDNEVMNDNEQGMDDSQVQQQQQQQLVREEEEGDEINVMATEPLESANTEDIEHEVEEEEVEDEQQQQDDEQDGEQGNNTASLKSVVC